MPVPPPSIETIIPEAGPEPLQIDLKTPTVVVIDRQNAFVSKGG